MLTLNVSVVYTHTHIHSVAQSEKFKCKKSKLVQMVMKDRSECTSDHMNNSYSLEFQCNEEDGKVYAEMCVCVYSGLMFKNAIQHSQLPSQI